MEELVLPLAEWKPDIINAAGQDNHYSDPLTNMNFKAKGYARLTEILNPDIVVLEGGYSIGGAAICKCGFDPGFSWSDYSTLKSRIGSRQFSAAAA